MTTIQKILGYRLTRSALGGATLILIARATMSLLPDCQLMPNFLSPWFALAIFLAVGYRIINAYGWSIVLQAMNHDVDKWQAIRVWLHAESRRWLPGGVWGYASRAIQAEQLGVPVKTASASMLIELLLTIAAAVIHVIPAVVIYREQFLEAASSLVQYTEVVLSLGVGIVLFGWVCFLLRTWIFEKLQSIEQRFQFVKKLDLDYRKLGVALGFFVLMGLLNGGVTCCLVWSMELDQSPPALIVIAATSFAWVVGFVAVIAPGGMIVREASFASCLVFWTPYASALAIAVLARVIQLVSEVVGMVWVWSYGLEWQRQQPTVSESDPALGL